MSAVWCMRWRSTRQTTGSGSVEFFGVKLKVNNPHLAALLNSSVSDDVQVIGRRARDVFAGDSPGDARGRSPAAR